MKRVASIALLLSTIILLAGPAFAQQQAIRLKRSESGFVPEPLNVNEMNATVELGEQMFASGHYYDFRGGSSAVVLVELKREDGTWSIRYPVAIVDDRKDQPPLDIPLYGPWFYEGDRSLVMSIDLLYLKKEHAAKLKARFSRVLDAASNFLQIIPVASTMLPQVKSGANTATGALDLFGALVEDELVPLGQFHLPRKPNAEEPKTFEGWHLLAGPWTEKYRGMKIESDEAGRPVVPKIRKARVMAVQLVAYPGTTTIREVAKRLDEFLGTQDKRLADAGVKFKNPFAGDRFAKEAYVRRNVREWLNKIEMRAGTGGTPEEPTTKLIEGLAAGQSGGVDGSVLEVLDEDENASVSEVVESLFSFEDASGAVVPVRTNTGMRDIVAWRNWLRARSRAKVVHWKTGVVVAPFAVIDTTYAMTKLNDALKELRAASEIPANVKLIGADIEFTPAPDFKNEQWKLSRFRSRLRAIFEPSSTDPYLPFEQRAVAAHLRAILPDLNLAPEGDVMSAESAAKFGAALDLKLSAKRILVYEKMNGAVPEHWTAPSLNSHAVGLWNKALRQIGELDPLTFNKHALLQQAFNIYILPARKQMNEAEREALDTTLGAALKDNLSGTPIGEAGYDTFLDENLFTVNSAGTISAPPTSKGAVEAMRYWRGVIGNPDGMKGVPPTAQDLLLEPTSVLGMMTSFISTGGSPTTELSVRVAVASQLKAFAPSLPEIPTTGKAEDWTNWRNEAVENVSSLSYDRSARIFTDTADSQFDVALGIRGAFERAKTNKVEPTEGSVRLAQLVEIYLNGRTEPARGLARQILAQYTELPEPLTSAAALPGTDNAYFVFVTGWTPSWIDGAWRSKPFVSAASVAAAFSAAKTSAVQPASGLDNLAQLVEFERSSAGVISLHSWIRGILEEYVSLPADLAATEDKYRVFLTRGPAWNGQRWVVMRASP